MFFVPLCETIKDNGRSEVTSANRYWGSDTSVTNSPVLGQQYAYAYDPIGNRISGGRASSQAAYDSNELNQYVSRTVPPTVSIIGSAPANVDMSVNGVAVDRQGNYWHSVVTVNNVPSPVYAEIEVLGIHTPPDPNAPPEYSISTNHLFVAQSPELFEYDLDGNLTQDGRFNYTWNARNQLICVETRNDLPVEIPRYRVEHAYDYRGRRIQKEVFAQDTGNWALSKSSSFVYDKWNLISETSVSSTPNSSLLTTNSISYMWGKDLSGKLQGAGGVGGLLAVIHNEETYYPTYDANGNISEYLDSTGSIVAHYEYDAFGNTVVEHSPLLKGGGGNAAGGLPFSFRFSTKYWDDEVGLYYYGYRYYRPKWAKWLNRDPIEEDGGINLYGFCGSDPVNKIDMLGMLKIGSIWGIPIEWGAVPGRSGDGYKEDRNDDRAPRNEPLSCCGKSKYDPSIERCENDKAVSKVSIWICNRRLLKPDSSIPRIGPLSHSFIVCEDPVLNPKTTEKYGKQPRPNNQESRWWGPGYIEREPYDNFDNCEKTKICPADKERMCKEGPTESPYILPSRWHNCHGWARCRSK